MPDHPDSTEMVHRAELVPHTYGPPSARDLEAITRLATQIASTEFVPSDLRGRPEAVLAATLYGREVGIGPMNALNKVHVIDGRPTMAAELMRALVHRAGHSLRVTTYTTDRVVIVGRRTDEDESTTVEWTWAEAQAAELADPTCQPLQHNLREITKRGRNGGTYTKQGCDCKDNWRKHPKAMLLARCTSDICRLLFPDVLAGISYTPDEVGGDVVDITDDGMILYAHPIAGDDDPEPDGDPDVPPPDVDPVEFRKRLFRAYRDDLDVVRAASAHYDDTVADQHDRARVDILDGASVKVDAARLQSNDPMQWGAAFADAPLGKLRRICSDVADQRDEYEADGRCAHRSEQGRRCALGARHGEDVHLPGDDDGVPDGPAPDDLPPDAHARPANGAGVSEAEQAVHAGMEAARARQAPDAAPSDAVPPAASDEDDGADPIVAARNRAVARSQQPGWCATCDHQHTGPCDGCPACADYDQQVRWMAQADPQDVVDRGYAEDLSQASELIAAAQDSLAAETPPDGPEPARDDENPPGPVSSDPADDVARERATQRVPAGQSPDAVRARFVEVVEGAGEVVRSTPIAEVVEKVKAGEWRPAVTLAVEYAMGPRSTLVPTLRKMCTDDECRQAADLSRWYRDQYLPSQDGDTPPPRAVEKLRQVQPGTVAFTHLRQEFGRRINDALAALRQVDREAAQLYGPRVADLGSLGSAPMAALAAMVDELDDAVASAQQDP